jgi:hypothetical protein
LDLQTARLSLASNRVIAHAVVRRHNRSLGLKGVEAMHESCAIPYRRTHSGIEFCLISQVRVNRWEFPKMPGRGDFLPDMLLDEAANSAGIDGVLVGEEPLAEFVAARAGESRHTSAYLLHVTTVRESWPQQSSRRRLWCLAEEARVRLRRKPMRRLIDVALQIIGSEGNVAATTVEQPVGL